MEFLLTNFSTPLVNSTNSQDAEADELEDYIGRKIRDIELGHRIFIIVFGSVGNGLSVIIFCSKQLRNLSSSFYLSALAISDTCFLLVLLSNWFQGIGVEIFVEDIYCRLQNYFTNVFGFLSVWFVVAFTVERFIAVQYPLMRPSMCTVSRAKVVIVCLFILSLLLYTPFLATEFEVGVAPDTNISSCGPANITAMDSAMIHIDMAVVMVVPCVVIVSINACICLTVHKLSRRRRRMTLNGRRLQDPSRMQQPSRSSSSQNKVTRLLLVVSSVFVCLNLPSYVCRLYITIQAENMNPTFLFIILQKISNLLYYTNFGINFVLYCVTGQNFRKSLVGVIFPQAVRHQETTRVTVVSECGTALSTRRRTITVNGTLTEAHEMLPLNG